MNSDWMQAAGTFALGLSAVLGLVFLVVYSVLAPWWRSQAGRYLWFSSAIFTVLLGYNWLALMGFLQTDNRPAIRFIIYSLILLVMVWRGGLLLLAQYEVYKRDKARLFARDGEPRWRRTGEPDGFEHRPKRPL